MIRLKTPVLLSLSLLILSGTSPSQDDPPAGMRSYKLKNGDRVRAEVISVEAGSVRYRFFAGGGSGITTRPLDAFDPRSQYNIKAGVAPDDLQTHLELAAFALDNDLIPEARRELFRARDLGKDLELAPDLEKKIMDKAIALLNEFIDKANLKEAHMILIEINKGERLTDEQKAHFVDLVEAKEKELEDAAANQRASRRQAQLSAETERLLKSLRDRQEAGETSARTALKNLKNQTRALNEYAKAGREFDQVLAEGKQLTERYSDDQHLVAEVEAITQQAQQEKIDAMLGEASIYTTRSSFNQALGKVGEVLAIDSTNEQALQMRSRIEMASNAGWRR